MPDDRPAMHLVPDDPLDQLARLWRFTEAHPDVQVAAGDGYWQAEVPGPDGSEQVITRHALKALLDKLDVLLG